jgi:hypothetical protein
MSFHLRLGTLLLAAVFVSSGCRSGSQRAPTAASTNPAGTTGTTQAPSAAIAATPTALDFGHVPLSLAPTLAVTVQNTGSAALAGSAAAAAPFSIVGPASYALAPGQSQTITVAFAPGAAGPAAGALALTGGGGASVALAGTGDFPALAKQYTEHVGRITNTPANPIDAIGLKGTDLGVSFPVGQDLVFLFGDSWTTDGQNWNDDSAARISAAPPPAGVPQLAWFETPPTPTRSVFRFLSLLVPGLDTGGMDVPLDGISWNGTTYVFWDSGWDPTAGRHSISALSHTSGEDFANLVLDHAVVSDKFINVSVALEGSTVWIFASGAYRKSAAYLATVDISTLADRASWRYFQGVVNGAPQFGAGEASAVPLFPENCIGELSVRKHPTLGIWLMTYNCASPRGIVLRTAPAPWGPWSATPTLIFDPGRDADHGYEHFMHAQDSFTGYDDGLAEPGREDEWGGEYGPYLIPQWFTDGPAPGLHTIVYTMSSWNPYAVHLMRTVLAVPGASAAPPQPGVGLAPAQLADADFSVDPYDPASGWSHSGDPFVRFFGAFGTQTWRLTTYGANGDATQGRLWQDFTVDAGTSTLNFAVHGGHAAVKLLRGDEVVRATRGRDENDHEIPVVWQLSEFRGETLRLLIDDEESDPWGFVSTSGFTLR